jgi:hypothetical protein
MASLAHSLKVLPGIEPPTRLRLTVSRALDGNPVPDIWSRGPVYRRLDSDFLEQPLIPKAPPTPRLRIDQVNGSLRVLDLLHSPAFSDMPSTVSMPEFGQPEMRQAEPPLTGNKPRFWYQAAAIAAGFAAGLAAAFLFGLL